MKFEDLLTKPIESMSDEEIHTLINKLDVSEITRLEKEVFNKSRKKKPSKKVIEDVNRFDQIVGVGDNVSK